MKDNAKQLFADFNGTGWQTPHLYERLFSLASNPAEAFYFAFEYLISYDNNENIFNDILSYVDKAQFAELISTALDILKIQHNENAEKRFPLCQFAVP